MTETRATLDPADPKHAHAIDRLAAERIGWLTTVDADGQPYTSPIWFLYEDGELLVYGARKSIRNPNLRANPKVAFNLDSDDEGDDVVTLEGIARFDPDAPKASDNPPYLAKYLPELERFGWTTERFETDYPHAIRVTPTRWRVTS